MVGKRGAMIGRFAPVLLLPLAGVALAAAPVALRGVAGGQWQVSRSATGAGAVKLCVPNPAALSQWEHRGAPCTRVVLSDKPGEMVIHYTCPPAGDFGRSKISVVTPRSLRIETTGIHRGEPFQYNLYARRTGDC